MQQTKKKTSAVLKQRHHAQIDTHRHPQAMEMVFDYIRPETALEKLILQQEDWMEGAFWGEPRYGHPEGKVIFHIREVLDNVEKATQNPWMRQQLRLITIIHDNFKHLEETIRPRQDWSKHHAVFASRFAEQFIEQQPILDIIEMHDEAYYAWILSNKQESGKAQERLKNIFDRIGSEYKQLYYLFFKCDTNTGDKTLTPVKWFEETVKGLELVTF